MKFKIGKLQIQIEIMFLIIVILIITFKAVRDYFENYIICFLFVAFHELSHVLVASICGVECRGIYIRVCGLNAVFKSQNRLSLKWLYIQIAGPLSNIILAIMFNKIKLVRDVNLALAIVNMLPISPLDGYGILKILLEFIMPKKKVNSFLMILKFVFLMLIFMLGIYLAIFAKNPSVLLFAFYVVILRNARKKLSLKYVTKKLQKCYKFLLKLLHFSLKFSII